MFNRKDYLLPDRQQALQKVFSLTLLLVLSFSFFNWKDGFFLLSIVEFCLFCSLSVLVYLSFRGANTTLLERLFIVHGMVLFPVLFVTGGEGGTGILWILTFPVLATYMRGVKEGLRWILAMTVLLIGLTLFFDIPIPHGDVVLVRFACVFFFFTWLAYHYQEQAQNMKTALNTERSISQLIDSLPVIVWVQDKDGKVQFFNDEMLDFCAQHGHALKIGQNIFKYFLKPLQKALPLSFEHHQKININLDWSCDTCGKHHYYDVHSYPVENQAMLVMMYDTHLQNQASLRLRHSERMSTIGEMAAGAAHEINNPLTSLLNYAELLKERASRQQPFADREARMLSQVHQSGLRIARIVRTLHQFGRADPNDRQALNIMDVIRAAIEWMDHRMKQEGIQIEIDSADDLPTLYANGTLLEQVFIQLLDNARLAVHHLPSPTDEAYRLLIRVYQDSQEKACVIEMIDHGIGMSDDVLKRAFEPFFTTRGSTRSQGLGLAISQDIIESHRGSIEIQSQAGVSTCVRIMLPLS